MERPQTLILPELSFPQLVKLFNDTKAGFPVSELWVPHLLEHDIIRIKTDSEISILLEILNPKRAWMYGFIEFLEKPHTKSVRKLEGVSFPLHIVLRSPIGFFKEQTYQHISASIKEIDLFIPELIPEDFFNI